MTSTLSTEQDTNTEAMSQRTKWNECDCYKAGKNLSDLPCQGMLVLPKVQEQWARFEDDVDDVVPLAGNCIQSNSKTNNDKI